MSNPKHRDSHPYLGTCYTNNPVNNRLRRGNIWSMACRDLCDIDFSAALLFNQIDHTSLAYCRDEQVLLAD